MKTQSNNQIIADSAPALTRRSAIGSILRKGLFASVLALLLHGNGSARAEEDFGVKSMSSMYATFLFDATPPFQVKGGTRVDFKVRLYYKKTPTANWQPYTGSSQPVTFMLPAIHGVSNTLLQTVYTDAKTGWATATFNTPKVSFQRWAGWNAKYHGDGRTLRPAPQIGATFILTP